VAFPHCYALSGTKHNPHIPTSPLCALDGLQSDPVRTDEMAPPGSQDTLMEDETASDLEVERTLVEDENSRRMVLVEKPTTHARQ
jgi:hypothetical protein